MPYDVISYWRPQLCDQRSYEKNEHDIRIKTLTWFCGETEYHFTCTPSYYVTGQSNDHP